MKPLLLFTCLGLAFCINLMAQPGGPASGNSFLNIPIPGSSQSWINMNNASVSDDNYASLGNIAGTTGSYTDYLLVTNFGLTVPAGVIISGMRYKLNVLIVTPVHLIIVPGLLKQVILELMKKPWELLILRMIVELCMGVILIYGGKHGLTYKLMISILE